MIQHVSADDRNPTINACIVATRSLTLLAGSVIRPLACSRSIASQPKPLPAAQGEDGLAEVNRPRLDPYDGYA